MLFIEFNIDSTIGINQGLISLSSVLKANDVDVDLLLISDFVDTPFNLDHIKEHILKTKPDIIGISLIETQLKFVKLFCEDAKNYFNGKIICGGPYASMAPDDTINMKGVDVVCIGEGEEALVSLLSDINKTDINNLWFKCGGSIIKNKLKPFRDIKNLPPPDYELYNLNTLIPLKNNQLEVMAGRGCMYKCTYCINTPYIDRYKKDCSGLKTKEYVRFLDVDTTINNIKQLKNRYNFKELAFIDDSFLTYHNFLDEFCYKYKKEIGLPFVCNANPLSLTDDKAKKLKDAGCDTIRFGIESGNERIRREILCRPMNNGVIINVFNITKRYNIKTSSYNMIGLPTETKEEVLDTLKLNAIIRPNFIKLMTFYPFKNTPIYDTCNDMGLINVRKKESLNNYNTTSCLKFVKEHIMFLEDVQLNFEKYINDYMTNSKYKYNKYANVSLAKLEIEK